MEEKYISKSYIKLVKDLRLFQAIQILPIGVWLWTITNLIKLYIRLDTSSKQYIANLFQKRQDNGKKKGQGKLKPTKTAKYTNIEERIRIIKEDILEALERFNLVQTKSWK